MEENKVPLGDSLDALNAAFLQAQEALTAFPERIACAVELYREGGMDWEGDYEPQRSFNLSFQKLGSKWCLGITVYEEGDRGDEFTRISSASLDLRLRAVASLPDLFEAMLARRAAKRAEVRAAVADVHSFIATVHAGVNLDE